MAAYTPNNRGRGLRRPIIFAVIWGALTVITLALTITAFSQWDAMAPLREGAVVITDGEVLPENEGKPVLVSGRATYEAMMCLM